MRWEHLHPVPPKDHNAGDSSFTNGKFIILPQSSSQNHTFHLKGCQTCRKKSQACPAAAPIGSSVPREGRRSLQTAGSPSSSSSPKCTPLLAALLAPAVTPACPALCAMARLPSHRPQPPSGLVAPSPPVQQQEKRWPSAAIQCSLFISEREMRSSPAAEPAPEPGIFLSSGFEKVGNEPTALFSSCCTPCPAPAPSPGSGALAWPGGCSRGAVFVLGSEQGSGHSWVLALPWWLQSQSLAQRWAL